jgi:hypothetical protein
MSSDLRGGRGRSWPGGGGAHKQGDRDKALSSSF